MTWRERSWQVLEPVCKKLATYQTIEELNEELFKVYPFGERDHHPYTVWLSCCKQVRAWWRSVHGIPQPGSDINFGLFAQTDDE